MKRIIICLVAFAFLFTVQGQELSKAIGEGNIDKVKDMLNQDPGLLDKKDLQGLTPLNKAAVEGKSEIAFELLRHGADPAIGDNENTLPVHQAAFTGNLDLFRVLYAKNPEIDIRDDNGMTPLHYSIQGKKPEMTKYLLEGGANVNAETRNKWTPLLFAAIFGPYETAEMLIGEKVNVNAKNNTGLTPLHSATSYGRTDIVKLLVENGARIDEPDEHGQTPIFLARNPNTYDAVSFLISKGAKVTRKDDFGRTPLMSAAGRGTVSLVELYLEHGADINAIDSNGWTALHMTTWARNPDEISKYLILHGADVNPVFCKHGTAKGCCTGVTTALHAAASSGNLALTKNLVDNGAKVNVLNADGFTPLFLAVRKGNPGVVKYLVDRGAFLNVADPSLGYTELMMAVVLGKKEIVDYLVKSGSDVTLKNKEGKSAIDLAWYYGHKQIAYSLLNNGGSDASLAREVSQPDLLAKPLNENEAAVWFLNHSGWAVKTKNHLLVFDYFVNPQETAPPDSSLACGFINPNELKDLNVTVFSTHSHGDHYSKEYFKWKSTIKNINYVMCFRPADASGEYTYIPIHGEQQVNGINISVVKSTDLDGGYLVEVDGVTIFHPGDLANGQDKLMKAYTDEIDWIAEKHKKIDIAFGPIRGCSLGQPNQVKLGIEYMIEKLNPAMFVPMHSGSATIEYKKFADDLSKKNYPTKIKYVVNRGDRFVYGDGKEIVQR